SPATSSDRSREGLARWGGEPRNRRHPFCLSASHVTTIVLSSIRRSHPMLSRRRVPSSSIRPTPLGLAMTSAVLLAGLTAGPAKANNCTGDGTVSQTVCVAAESFAATLSVGQQSLLNHTLTTA